MSSFVVKRITVEAGKAVPNPQMASALGPRGVAPPLFCQKANELCNSIEGLEKGALVRLAITEVDKKRNFKLKFLGLVTSDIIKKHLGLQKCASNPGKEVVKTITKSDLLMLVRKKMSYLNVFCEQKALKMFEGTARSMGISVIE